MKHPNMPFHILVVYSMKLSAHLSQFHGPKPIHSWTKVTISGRTPGNPSSSTNLGRRPLLHPGGGGGNPPVAPACHLVLTPFAASRILWRTSPLAAALVILQCTNDGSSSP
jgi:hypothetical protein